MAHSAVEVTPLLVGRGRFGGLGVPLRGDVVGHGPGVGALGGAFGGAPGGFGGGQALIVAFLGDGGIDPGAPVEGAMLAHVVVVEGVEVSAELVALGGGLAVALGGDEADGDVAQADEFAGFC